MSPSVGGPSGAPPMPGVEAFPGRNRLKGTPARGGANDGRDAESVERRCAVFQVAADYGLVFVKNLP
jgi:hypothetical protein